MDIGAEQTGVYDISAGQRVANGGLLNSAFSYPVARGQNRTTPKMPMPKSCVGMTDHQQPQKAHLPNDAAPNQGSLLTAAGGSCLPNGKQIEEQADQQGLEPVGWLCVTPPATQSRIILPSSVHVSPVPDDAGMSALIEGSSDAPLYFCVDPAENDNSRAVVSSFCSEGLVQENFLTPTLFTRWLFGQPRGTANLQSVLVTGWRESKPCAMALVAARLGDANQLRPDSRRPDLMPVYPPLIANEEAEIVIKTLVIVTQTPDQAARAPKWAKQKDMMSLDIRLVRDIEALRALLPRLSKCATQYQ
jgi:hypothetical protein